MKFCILSTPLISWPEDVSCDETGYHVLINYFTQSRLGIFE